MFVKKPYQKDKSNNANYENYYPSFDPVSLFHLPRVQ